MNTKLNRTIKRKIGKTIELILEAQQEQYNSRLTDIQLRLETIYDVLHNDDIEVRREKGRLNYANKQWTKGKQYMYFIIFKPTNVYKLFSNEVFRTEEEAEDYGKRNKFRKVKWKVVMYNKDNVRRYWKWKSIECGDKK